MFYLIYTSIAREGIQMQDLREILDKARECNQRNGITGLLLFKNNRFMQLIEGDEAHVQELMEKIRSDHRHSNILVLQSDQAESRQFSDWSMAFRSPNLSDGISLSHPSEIAFTTEALTAHSSRATKLLHLFEEHI